MNATPVFLVIVAVVVFLFDGGIVGNSIYDGQMVNDRGEKSIGLPITVGILWFVTALTVFMMGLSITNIPYGVRRWVSCGILTVVAAIATLMSAYFNFDVFAGQSAEKRYYEIRAHNLNKAANEIVEWTQASESNESNFSTLAEVAKSMADSEYATGAVSGTAGGSGPIHAALMGIYKFATKSREKLLLLAAQTDPLVRSVRSVQEEVRDIPSYRNMSFDDQQNGMQIQSEKINKDLRQLQALFPESLFKDANNYLAKSYGAQMFSEEASLRMSQTFLPFANTFKDMASDLRRAKKIYVPKVEKPEKLDVLTASSNGFGLGALSLILASITWVALGWHIFNTPAPHSEIKVRNFKANK